jgi:hypothetical protein
VASYNADINLNIVGASRLNTVVASVAKLNALAQDLKPINLVAPGGGKLGDKIREAIKPINDFAREVTNGTKRISNTFAGASQQADVFRTVLDNVKIAAGGFSKQTAPVKLYAAALTEAQTQVRRLGAAQNDLLRTSKGLQLQDERNIETSRRFTRVIELRRQQTQGAALAQRGRESASNALIGGAFPLLFGQGAGAAVGGGLGGALGGAFGGTLGFGLSLVGTAIGQAVDDARKLNVELNSLNNNLSSTGSTSKTTASDISQLASQLGIAKEEALKLVNAFSEFGSADVREALAASFGAVGGEAAFDALAAAIDNKSTLEAIVKLRDTITDIQAKEALKQLELNGAAAANAFLQERLIQLQEQKLIKIAEEVTLMDRILAAAAALGAQGQFIDPAIFGQERADEIRKGAAERKKAQTQALQDTRKFLSEVARLNERYSTKARTRTGPKPPEDRTASLQADLQAIIEIGNAEDLIRDLRFQGRDLLVVDVELAKVLADVERDRVKQLERANYESERSTINEIAKTRTINAQREATDKIREINSQRFQDELRAQETVRNAVKPFKDLVQQQELQAQYSKTYLRLVTEGMLPAEAERIANFEQLVIQQTTAVEEQLKITEAAILEAKARGASTVELEKQLNTLKQQQTAIQGAAAAGPGQGMTNEQRAANAIAQIRGEINALADPINAAVTGANAIGSAFQQAFQGLVTGSMTAQEALSSFFKSIGEAFVSMAAEIIAKQLVMITLQTILKALGFAGGGGGGGGTPMDLSGTQTFNVPVSQMPAGMAFAEGGFVTGPTNALIGEGGESEYVIPASKMRGAMSRYAGGARGNNVIPGSGAEGGAEQGGVATMEPIDVRYSVERINNVDYVTADQFQRGMAQAAQQGAIQGERRAMRTLKTSAATRRGVGI